MEIESDCDEPSSIAFSYNTLENDCDKPKVVRMDSLKPGLSETVLCQSTAFESSVVAPIGDPDDIKRCQSVLSEEITDKETTSAASGSDLEEHRYLSQSLASLSDHDYYSFCNESDLSCSTLGENLPPYDSSCTDVSSWEEDYSDDDGHYPLIQLPTSSSGDNLEFWPRSDTVSHCSFADEIEFPSHKQQQEELGEEGGKERDGDLEPPLCEEHEEEEQQQLYADKEGILEQENKEFCLQCHAWPEVEDCGGERFWVIACPLLVCIYRSTKKFL
jgi:hypothetical protein